MLGNLGWTCRFWNYWICSQRMGLLEANCQSTELSFWSIGEVPPEAQLLRVFKPFSKCKFWFGIEIGLSVCRGVFLVKTRVYEGRPDNKV